MVVGTAGGLYLRSRFESRYMAADSMRPTLNVDDRILIDKSRDSRENIRRGDIIIFKPNQMLTAQGYNAPFIKRVIALPGETVAVRGGVWINGRQLRENYILETPQYQFGPVTVPPNSYFVLGDNRNNSYDSHIWGFITQDLVMGRATRIYLPPERARELPRPETRYFPTQ